MSAAGFGGLLYWVSIFPLDVVKSAMASDTIVKSERVYTDMVTTTKVQPATMKQVCISMHVLLVIA